MKNVYAVEDNKIKEAEMLFETDLRKNRGKNLLHQKK
jgi:hypothetical protein